MASTPQYPVEHRQVQPPIPGSLDLARPEQLVRPEPAQLSPPVVTPAQPAPELSVSRTGQELQASVQTAPVPTVAPVHEVSHSDGSAALKASSLERFAEMREPNALSWLEAHMADDNQPELFQGD